MYGRRLTKSFYCSGRRFTLQSSEIGDAMILELESQKLGANKEQRDIMSQEIEALPEFEASTYWFHNFKQSKFLVSMKPRGEVGMLIPGEMEKPRVKRMCTGHS